MPYQSFLKGFFVIAFGFTLGVAGFNYFIDPYGIFQTPTIQGINQAKTEITKHERLYKKIRLSVEKPQAVLLGNSIVVNGFNPSEVYAFSQEKFYNAGIGGAPFDEIYANFEYCLKCQPKLKKVILGIDYAGFNQFPKVFAFKESMTHSQNQVFTGLFSIHSLMDSLKTFKANRQCVNTVCFDQNGFLVGYDLQYELKKKYYNQLKDIVQPYYQHFVLDNERIELFQKLVETCQKKGIELFVFVGPAHAQYCEVIYQAGLWPSFEELKRKLCAIHPLWDFSGYNTVTTTPFVNYDNPFYQDHSHFFPNIGNEIIKMMFYHQNAFQDFGKLLTPLNIEEHLHQIHQQRMTWINHHEYAI